MGDRWLRVAIFIRDGHRNRLGENKTDLPPSVRVPPDLKAELLGVDPERFHGLNGDSRSQVFLDRLADLDGHVIGVALIKTQFVGNCMMALSRNQLAVRRFWLLTKYGGMMLLWVDFCTCVRLVEPLAVHGDVLRRVPFSFFFQMTEFSAQRLWDEPTEMGRTVRQVFPQRCAHYGVQADDQPIDLAWIVSAPHALLLLHRRWPAYAFPLAQTRGTGIHLARRLYAGLDLDDEADPLGGPPQFGPDEYEDGMWTTMSHNIVGVLVACS